MDIQKMHNHLRTNKIFFNKSKIAIQIGFHDGPSNFCNWVYNKFDRTKFPNDCILPLDNLLTRLSFSPEKMLQWKPVTKHMPIANRKVICANIMDQWVDAAEYWPEENVWYNGEVEIIPTHWREFPPGP